MKLVENSYGKGRVRLSKVIREGNRYTLLEYTVQVMLGGAFEATYTEGDNSAVIPTDTVRNTVYALAAQTSFASPEELGLALVQHFVNSFPQVAWAHAQLEEAPWSRIVHHGQPHPHAFTRANGGIRTAEIRLERGGEPVLRGGVCGLEVVKTTASEFTGYVTDRYTTLKETTDRIFGTTIEATWQYARKTDFQAAHAAACQHLLEVFAEHHSLSVQQTLLAMGRRVLEQVPDLQRIDLTMPNQHRIGFDLTPLGLPNLNEIFVTTSEPFGLIKGSVARE